MFYRVWVLYVPKLFLLGFVLVVTAMVKPDWSFSGTFQNIGLAIVFPIGIVGVTVALFALSIQNKFACPICNDDGKLVIFGKSPALDCSRCGFVYCKHPSWSFKLSVEPHERKAKSGNR